MALYLLNPGPGAFEVIVGVDFLSANLAVRRV